MSQREFAQLLDVRPNDVGRWERGENAQPVAYLGRVADAFDVTFDWLVGRTDRRRPDDRNGSPGAAQGRTAVAALDPRTLRRIIALTHPDRQPPERRPEATEVTQLLNELCQGNRPTAAPAASTPSAS
jgi:transcriptional regulator with XRE-family HTH domain